MLISGGGRGEKIIKDKNLRSKNQEMIEDVRLSCTMKTITPTTGLYRIHG